MEDYLACGILTNVIKTFYRKNITFVRIKKWEGELLKVEVGLRQGCVMSSRLFNIFIDSVDRNMDRSGKRNDIHDGN